MKVYSGHRADGACVVRCNDRDFTPDRSLKVRNHSPTGFGWGYSGSGPAQLALALLLDVAGQHTAERYYQRFKSEVVAHWGPTWNTTDEDIFGWILQATGEMPAKGVPLD